MDWSRIKTIFIISFLLLNIYLLHEFLKIRTDNQHEYATNPTLENRLKADKITYVELPKNYVKDTYLTAIPKVFSQEEVTKQEGVLLKNQTVTVKNGNYVESVLGTPLKVSDKGSPAELEAFIKSNVLYGEQYRYWSRNADDQTITYYQQYKGKIFYSNFNGEITFSLNDDNKVVSYKQTYLEKIEELSDEERVLQPIKALETLYENGYLKYGTEIKKVEFGYYTLVHLTTSQVLTPAWHFVTAEEESLFVNAFDGKVIQLTSEETSLE